MASESRCFCRRAALFTDAAFGISGSIKGSGALDIPNAQPFCTMLSHHSVAPPTGTVGKNLQHVVNLLVDLQLY
jgi:hypothetical protein